MSPANDETRSTGNAAGLRGQETQPGCRTTTVAAGEAFARARDPCTRGGLASRFDEKLFSTLQARLALAGFAATKINGDKGELLAVVTRWHLTKCFDSLTELEQFVDRAEGVPA